jgi:ribose 5-phosphate isomerase A
VSTDENKQRVALAALDYVPQGGVLGVGTGSTVKYLIDALAARPRTIRAAVSSSSASSERLKAAGIEVVDLNDVSQLTLYIDGADEATRHRHLIKGGGAALTREKIIAQAAREFVCIVDATKLVERLGMQPLPIEVIPMARTLVERYLMQLGGRPIWRRQVTTDNGNHVLDVQGLTLDEPAALEGAINQIPGVVTVGLFARRPADLLLVGTDDGVVKI